MPVLPGRHTPRCPAARRHDHAAGGPCSVGGTTAHLAKAVSGHAADRAPGRCEPGRPASTGGPAPRTAGL